jgi:hypothetical protein
MEQNRVNAAVTSIGEPVAENEYDWINVSTL